MTARSAIARDSIVDAALVLIREGGWDAVSARAIAERLGASTMPIYSAIGSMEALKQEAFARACALLAESQQKPRSGEGALDLALGYVAFARSEPRLFHFISAMQRDLRTAMASATADTGKPGGLGDMPELRFVLERLAAPENKEDFVLRTFIFTHGLASLLADGSLVLKDEDIARHLREAGGAFYRYQTHEEEGR